MPTQPYYQTFEPGIIDPFLHRLMLKSNKRKPNPGNKIRVPGCTTVLASMGFNKRPLMYWAYNLGQDPHNAGKRFNDISKDDADIGTIAHAAVEADVNGEEWDPEELKKAGLPDEMYQKVLRCGEAWGQWKGQSHLEIVEAEVSLIDPVFMFGGTSDLISVFGRCKILGLRGRYGLADIKSGKGFFVDQLVQVRAYGEAWNRKHPDKLIEEYHVIRIGKEDASFKHGRWPSAALDWAWDMFKAARYLYELNKIGMKAL